MINTLLWVIDDSHLLEVNVTNKDLGPAPPILLNTTNLSILLPGITKWKNKGNFYFYFRGCLARRTFQHIFVVVRQKWKNFCCFECFNKVCRLPNWRLFYL